ncbi:hypothetical protein [Polymorphum gilvum]|uniref:Transmembrane protein n=1 Tax=Polymorphum gilvum (strain LMG 25793 / CGMCC 1.9160 / SL003B-26A1) TaxID=991905 RepID=F2J2Z9_POLGS|nr:hypothetical protein [Polymorphum gilvum]ADZ68869.1 hypothetical protein SL003B_0434 [Polymorphum gilvum SL003B-26A1]
MAGHEERAREREEEARRALKRVEAESETLLGSTFVRMANKAQTHFSAADKEKSDAAEVWGSRIGRAAGLVFAIGLVIHLVWTYLL